MKKYNAYKPSGIEWVGDIPEKWETMKLKHVLSDYQDGTHASYKRVLSDYPLLSAKNVFEDGIKITAEESTISESDYKSIISNGFPKQGDVAICCVGTIGRCCLYTLSEPQAFQRSVTFLRTNRKILNNYLVYLMRSDIANPQYVMYAKTSAQSGIYMESLVNFKIVLPPKEEQVAIASYLGAKCAKIDNVLSVQRKRIELLKELKQSIITNAVTKGLDKNAKLKPSGVEWIGDIPEKWKLMKLKYICKDEKYSIKTGPFGSQLKGEDLREEGDVRVYNQRNVIDDCFDDVQFYVTSAKAKDLQSFFTKENDLLVTSRGTIGKCSLLPKTAPMGVLHPCLIALRINEKKCSLQWAKFFINESDCFKTNVFLNSNATTIEVIYTDTLKNIFIPLPPLKEQLAIISYLEHRCSAIDSQISKIERQIELLKEYKQSIITECVTGKRKVC